MALSSHSLQSQGEGLFACFISVLFIFYDSFAFISFWRHYILSSGKKCCGKNVRDRM